MSLREDLEQYGCSQEFIELAMKFEKFYKEGQSIEDFIEYAEDRLAEEEEDAEEYVDYEEDEDDDEYACDSCDAQDDGMGEQDEEEADGEEFL